MTPPGAWSTAEGAAGWQASAAQRQQSLAAATELMLQQAGIGSGMRVLDVGAGTGDLALLVAGRVGPAGSVLATDVSGAMLEVAARLSREARLSNVETLAVGAEDLSLPEASFDAALSRNCLMFVDDLPRALRAVRSALRRGARFAASVWGPLERNVYHGAPLAAVRKRGAIPSPAPEVVRAFSMPGGEPVADALQSAGFSDVQARRAPAPRRFPSLEEGVRAARGFPTFVALLQLLSEAEREQVWAEVARDWSRFATAAGLELPGEQVVLSATA